MELVLRTEQDPLVMMAWRCKKLQEIVIHGYVLDPHNLVGVSRLRGRELQLLEVSRVDLSISSVMMAPFIEVGLYTSTSVPCLPSDVSFAFHTGNKHTTRPKVVPTRYENSSPGTWFLPGVRRGA